MALLSMLDKVKITADIGEQLQSQDIQNNQTLTITIACTAGQTTEETVTDNSWNISIS